MLCFVVVMQSFIMNSHQVFIHIHQGCFAGTGAIVRLPQCQWSKPDGYGKISQCITTTKHSKAKTVCIFLGIYCNWELIRAQLNICDQLKAASSNLAQRHKSPWLGSLSFETEIDFDLQFEIKLIKSKFTPFELVRGITYHRFKPRSPDLDRCKYLG